VPARATDEQKVKDTIRRTHVDVEKAGSTTRKA